MESVFLSLHRTRHAHSIYNFHFKKAKTKPPVLSLSSPYISHRHWTWLSIFLNFLNSYSQRLLPPDVEKQTTKQKQVASHRVFMILVFFFFSKVIFLPYFKEEITGRWYDWSHYSHLYAVSYYFILNQIAKFLQ